MTMIANDNLPATVEQAVRALESLVPPTEQARIAALSEADLSLLHFGLGQWILNHFGLWSGNQRLLDDTGQIHADDASDVIVRMFWLQLRSHLPQLH
ncbi:MAG: hypothetical protein Q7K57_32200 [Burkholderiaceae bacterium]|nr:hypothetical protein [Burkholderiaceae bacterium]